MQRRVQEGERGGLRVHVGQPHSTVDEGDGEGVMLFYPLSGWTMQMKGYRSVREGETRSCATTPFYSG